MILVLRMLDIAECLIDEEMRIIVEELEFYVGQSSLDLTEELASVPSFRLLNRKRCIQDPRTERY